MFPPATTRDTRSVIVVDHRTISPPQKKGSSRDRCRLSRSSKGNEPSVIELVFPRDKVRALSCS